MITETHIQACQQYDRYAQKAIYNYTVDRLYKVSLRYCRDTHEAKDVLHDAFIKIFTKVTTFEGTPSNFEKWMTRIVVNQALENYRRQKKIVFTEDSELNYTEQFIQPSIFAHMELENIKLIIEQLPDPLKINFKLYVIDGFSHREIAELLNIKESTSRSGVSRAKKALHHLISKSKCSSK